MNYRKYADAAGKLAALPVRGMHIGETPYVMLHALDRDALVDLLARLSTESETHSNGWIDQRALEIARSIAADYGIFDAQLIARIQIGVVEGIKSMLSTAPEAPQAPSGEMLEAAIEQAYCAGFSQGCEWIEGAGCTEQWEAEEAYAKGYTREALLALAATTQAPSGDFARGWREGIEAAAKKAEEVGRLGTPFISRVLVPEACKGFAEAAGWIAQDIRALATEGGGESTT